MEVVERSKRYIPLCWLIGYFSLFLASFLLPEGWVKTRLRGSSKWGLDDFLSLLSDVGS